jgi:hypothetical protein
MKPRPQNQRSPELPGEIIRLMRKDPSAGEEVRKQKIEQAARDLIISDEEFQEQQNLVQGVLKLDFSGSPRSSIPPCAFFYRNETTVHYQKTETTIIMVPQNRPSARNGRQG